MSGLVDWGAGALLASTMLMVLVLAIRAPVRRWIGPRLAYGLWALPVLRMAMPPLPFNWPWADEVPAGDMTIVFTGPMGAPGLSGGLGMSFPGAVILAIWLAGALALLGIYAIRHVLFCARLRRASVTIGSAGTVRIISTDVEGPLAFGVIHRFIAVPRRFEQTFDTVERDLVLAHEAAHHARGDLSANWLSLIMLAAHWWNPCAWFAIRAFREDQEFSVDAQVLAGRGPAALSIYAFALVKAAGVGAPPACSLTTRSSLKGRLMMLAQKPKSRRRRLLGGSSLALLGGMVLAATTATAGGAKDGQAVTIGVKPDGSGHFALIVDGRAIAPGAALPSGMSLPTGVGTAWGCPLARDARPYAMVIKGTGRVTTFTVMCASATPAPVRATLTQGLASLKTMRASVAVQESPTFPPSERVHALSAVDTSIHEVEATLSGRS